MAARPVTPLRVTNWWTLLSSCVLVPRTEPQLPQCYNRRVMIRTIAIDGPAASGKTAVGRLVAMALGFWFLDTGIMYRAVTWLALGRGVPPDDADALGCLAGEVQLRPVSMLGDSVEVAGIIVGAELRGPSVDRIVSEVSRHSAVRRALVEQQRAYADAVVCTGNGTGDETLRPGIIMIGRDIGTVVLPSADLKIFLTASARVRARRRCEEMRARGHAADLETVKREIEARDATDSSRDDSPLRPAADAWELDTSELDVDGVVKSILQRVKDS